MSNRDHLLLIQDMLESAQKSLKYTESYTYLRFIDDDKTIDAVIRNFEIIGEAANRINEEFKSSTTQIEWQKLRGFRNWIVHAYFGVDYEIVWTIIQEDIPNSISDLSNFDQ